MYFLKVLAALISLHIKTTYFQIFGDGSEKWPLLKIILMTLKQALKIAAEHFITW